MLEEKLKLLPGWLLTFLIMDFVIVLIIVFAVNQSEDPQSTTTIMLILGACLLLIFMLLNYIHFKVKMGYRDISIRMVPFSLKPRLIAQNDIVAWKIRPLSVMKEFSGYGKRKKGNTTAYVVDSKFAIEFDLSNGHKIVMSIRNNDEWQRTLERSTVWAEKMRVS